MRTSNARVELSIVIVNWNSQECLKRCIASILAHVRMTRYEVVVIDSGSFDGCGRMVSEHYPQVRFIQSAENIGFAKANNRAVEACESDCLLFLNPDTEVTGSAVDLLYACLTSHPEAGVVGCTLLNRDGTVQTSCIQSIPTITNQVLDSEFLRRRWRMSSLWGMRALFGERGGVREVEAISGACLMVRRKLFEDVGRFSEEYFMYVEDIDLSYKVRRAGYRNYYVPDAVVIHHGGSSVERAVSAFAAIMSREAVWRFLRKTRGHAYGLAYRLGMLATAIGRLAVLGVASRAGLGSQASEASRRKWLAILRWSVRGDRIVKQYYPATERVATRR